MTKSTPTLADLQNLSEEELAAVKKQATRQIVKFIAIKVGVTVAVVAATHLITKKLEAGTVAETVATLTE